MWTIKYFGFYYLGRDNWSWDMNVIISLQECIYKLGAKVEDINVLGYDNKVKVVMGVFDYFKKANTPRNTWKYHRSLGQEGEQREGIVVFDCF